VTEIGQSIAQTKRRILAESGVWRDLKPILEAGMSQGALLDLLARTVMPCSRPTIADEIRRKQQELRSVAAQVRTTVHHAERVANSSSNYIAFRSPFRNVDFERYRDEEPKKRASQWPFKEMLGYADWAEKEARHFGELLRRNARKEPRLEVLSLLSTVYAQTGATFEQQLARLLTDAAEAVGRSEKFTAGGLTKMYKRHVFGPAGKKQNRR
jgi:hypothetical protein